jgi:hypothetical protein
MSRLTESIPLVRRLPRGFTWFAIALLLLATIALTSPAQIPVVIYKLALVALSASIGYWIDRALFPYSRPDGYLQRDWRYGTDEPEGDVDFPVVGPYHRVFAAAQIRRAIIVGTVVLGVALGM